MQQVEELMLTQEHNKALVDHPVQIELVVYRMHSPQDVPILPVSWFNLMAIQLRVR